MEKEPDVELACLNHNQTGNGVVKTVSDTSLSSSNVDDADEGRGVWKNKAEFFLAIMGYTVGIGSVWRFPIICSRNGGGAFLIPFFFFLITSGWPLYYLEVCIGQFSGISAGLAFEFCPILKGLGLLQVTLSVTVLWYLVVIMMWVLYYFYNSFFPVMPWTTCDNNWNTIYCRDINNGYSPLLNITNGTSLVYGFGDLNNSIPTNLKDIKFQSAAFEFWEYKAIMRSSGLEQLGSVQPHLLICLFLSWFFVVAAVVKGVKTLGKVVYVTATAPYLLLTIMLIKGLTLDGAIDGIKVYIYPDFSKLLSIQVWLEAAIQVFYSLGPSWGGVITMASYNRFHQKSFWSSTMCVVTAGFTAFYNGLVVFTLLGFMAKESGMSVEAVAKQSGPGLAFVAFPIAISKMPVPNLWSVLFFLTLVTVVFDSLFGMLETVTSHIVDTFPRTLVRHRVKVNIATGTAFFLCGIPFTMNGGIYLFQLSDWYFSQFGLLFGSFFELVGLCWIYGTDRFSRDISLMTGRKVSVTMRLFWHVVIPILAGAVFLVMLTKYSSPVYGDGYMYSTGAIGAGIFVGMLPIIVVVVMAGIELLKAEGSLIERFRKTLKPSSKWKPNNRAARQKYEMKPYVYPDSWIKRLIIDLRGSN